MNKDIEKYLSKFKLGEPPPELEQKIISNTATIWNTQEYDPEIPGGLRLTLKIFFPAAAAILIGILFLNSIFSPLPEINNKYDIEAKQLVDLGISENISKIIMIVKENKRTEFISYKKYLQEDQS